MKSITQQSAPALTPTEWLGDWKRESKKVRGGSKGILLLASILLTSLPTQMSLLFPLASWNADKNRNNMPYSS